jgi:hypothetical protein
MQRLWLQIENLRLRICRHAAESAVAIGLTVLLLVGVAAGMFRNRKPYTRGYWAGYHQYAIEVGLESSRQRRISLQLVVNLPPPEMKSFQAGFRDGYSEAQKVLAKTFRESSH